MKDLSDKKDKMLYVRLNEKSYDAFEKLCRTKNITVSKALREALKDWYIKNK